MQWDPETAHMGGRVIEMLSEHSQSRPSLALLPEY